MKACGVLAVESLSPQPTGDVAIREARQILGSGVGIIGGIEPTLLLNTPLKNLPGYVEQVIEEAAGGPFVLANSDSCPPGVTAEKFALIAQVARRHRR
jgi:uroporphyrinogen-III decarboxylase